MAADYDTQQSYVCLFILLERRSVGLSAELCIRNDVMVNASGHRTWSFT